MIEFHADETTYSEIAPGLAKEVVRSLIRQLGNNGVLDLAQEPTNRELNMIFAIAFDVLSQFEDLRGHVFGDQRYPAVVGFVRVPADGKLDPYAPEKVLVSPRKTDLHGSVDDTLIRHVFRELQSP